MADCKKNTKSNSKKKAPASSNLKKEKARIIAECKKNPHQSNGGPIR